MARREVSLGVDWFLPGQKRRFATTTVASSNLIVYIAESGDMRGPGLTWRQVAAQINYDPEAKAVAERFVAEGYGDHSARDMVCRGEAPPDVPANAKPVYADGDPASDPDET